MLSLFGHTNSKVLTQYVNDCVGYSEDAALSIERLARVGTLIRLT